MAGRSTCRGCSMTRGSNRRACSGSRATAATAMEMAMTVGGIVVSRDSQLALIDGPAIDTDVVIVGAGPVGLFQVFELGLLGLKAHVIDSLPAAGGQCIELYPDKPIYDIPAIPVCTGRELIERLLEQIRPFEAGLHLAQEVTEVHRRDDGRFHVVTSRGTHF